MEYEEVRLIKRSERSTVRLVYEKSEGHFYIWKVLAGELHIYQTLQGCSHPCLPKLYDVVINDGVTTVIEEYVEGQTLDRVSISKKQFRSVVKDLCSALEFLHGMGIIHRDLKPSNIIFMANEHICLIDFDAARMPKEDLEQDTRLLGTRGYAPPEQYGFSQTDVRTDIYSLGVTLDQIMEGRIRKKRYKRIVKKCMNLNPDKRYQTIRQVRKAFFPAKRNVGCACILLLLVSIFWNDIEIMSKNITEHFVQMQEQSNTNSNEILFADAPVYGYLGRSIEDIINERGEPDYFDNSGGSASLCSYPEIEFYFDGYRGVYNIFLNAAECTYNGQTLNRDRNKLNEILGKPSSEGWENVYNDNMYSKIMDVDAVYQLRGNLYYMEYKDFDENIDIKFYFTSLNNRAFMMGIG